MTHFRYEILRTLRNPAFMGITLGLPLVLFYSVASGQRHATFNGTAFPLYFMTAMAAYGAMYATVVPGARIVRDRTSGWLRQMRITPLRPGTYFRAKVLAAYLRALLTIALLCLAGTALGVRLSAREWLIVVGLLLVGLVPFAAGGIALGHVIASDASAPAVGGIVTLFCLLGGVYGFQIANSGAMFQVIRGLPSYWLAQAGKTALAGGGWPAEGWIVVAAWTAVLVPIAVLVYRRDTSRV